MPYATPSPMYIQFRNHYSKEIFHRIFAHPYIQQEWSLSDRNRDEQNKNRQPERMQQNDYSLRKFYNRSKHFGIFPMGFGVPCKNNVAKSNIKTAVVMFSNNNNQENDIHSERTQCFRASSSSIEWCEIIFHNSFSFFSVFTLVAIDFKCERVRQGENN